MKLETDQSDPSSTPVASGTRSPAASPPKAAASAWPKSRGFRVFTLVLVACFALPLFHLLRFVLHSELYAHILLIPFISGFLIWMQRERAVSTLQPSPRLAFLPFVIGALLLVGYRVALRKGWTPEVPDSLAVTTFAFLCFWLAGGFLFLGAKYLKSIAFPVAFLLFCIPFPLVVRDGIEYLLQHGSADVASAMLSVSGMPVLQTGTELLLPNQRLIVAAECSGIHSTLILFITTVVAAYLFLEKSINRSVLMLVVLPLAILRNAFRIFVIAQLCVHIGPQMLDSPIHHHGGILFFGLSLIPLFLLLSYLTKRESRKKQAMAVSSQT